MANDFEHRIKGLEDREGILYGYINELRGWVVELREEHKDSRKRIEQNELMIHEIVEIQGDMLKLLERMDQKLDNLGKPGTNGHS